MWTAVTLSTPLAIDVPTLCVQIKRKEGILTFSTSVAMGAGPPATGPPTFGCAAGGEAGGSDTRLLPPAVVVVEVPSAVCV